MKISSVTEYNSITKSNWVNKANNTGMMYDYTVDKNNLISIVDLNITWKGDIDLSHSPIPTNNQTSKFIKTSKSISKESTIFLDYSTELIEGKVVAYISLDSNNLKLGGLQFRLNFDNSILTLDKVEFSQTNLTNFNNKKETYINLGTLVIDRQSFIPSGTEYKIIFTPITPIKSTIGLISVSNTEGISTDSNKLIIEVR
jgi:hypothetical protein